MEKLGKLPDAGNTRMPVQPKPDLLERFSKLTPIKFEFESYGKRKSVCDLIVSKKNNIAIATEIEENDGHSISNVTQALAINVCINYELDITKLILIIHYSNRSYQGGREDEEEFAMVTFKKDFSQPEFSFLPLKQVEEFLNLLE